jgi:SAM-dependent methyltransferase
MNRIEILKSLSRYSNEEFKCKFLLETIKYIQKLNTSIITEIGDNKYILAAIRIYLLYNKLNYYLTHEIINNTAYRYIKLSNKGMANLINQIDGVDENNFAICKKLDVENKKYFLIISDIQISGYEPINEDIMFVLLGIHSLYFLEKQNLEHYCNPEIIKNAKMIIKDLTSIRIKLKQMKPTLRDRLIMFSGLLYHFLGAVYTSDIDCIFVAKNENEIGYIEKKITEISDITFVNYSNVRQYKDIYYKYIYPQYGGSENIYENLINPEKHFYFMGIKCIDVYTNFQKSISRSHPFSYIDAILLNKINNIDFYKDYCLKNISIRQGKAIITNDNKDMKQFKETVVKYLKMWYGIEIDKNKTKSLKFLNKNLVKCTKKKGTIYEPSNNIYRDPLSIKQAIIHRNISDFYIEKYGKNMKSLLDIGSGKLSKSTAEIYDKIGLNEVYGIEPSGESIKIAKERINILQKKGSNVKYKLFQGNGEDTLPFKKKFDIITFIFTIHYMMGNIDKVIKNLLEVSKSNTKIIITCINGNDIFEKLKKEGQYEIKYNNDIYWGVYKYNEPIKTMPVKALFFMKDIYGLENGSEEYLVDIDELINKFENKGFTLLNRTNFLDNKNISKNNLLPFQKKILELHELLVFNKV